MNPKDLRQRTDALMRIDRERFRRRLGGAQKIRDRDRRAGVLETIAKDLTAAEARMGIRRAALPESIRYPDDLPITARRADLLSAIRDNQVVIVAGETGSGKSTQLPKFCLELGRGVEGMIGHTQPRRIAARSIAERVAEELGSTVGEMVGYTVRFTDQVGDGTLVKLMTDGILLAEIHNDRNLDRYDTIILDEAHERSLNTDFLIGYVKSLLPRRPDLKLIVTSATIDTGRFSEHFGGAPVVEVSGRTYPVEIRYRPIDDPSSSEPRDQPEAIADAVEELADAGQGDVLVFVSGEREIRDAVSAIEELGLRHTETLPLYGRLSASEQHRVFQAHTGRRIVIATNVAETSLTVPGIRYVVDAGTARISRYSRRTKVQQLPIEPVSQASANQRAGRCGRLGPGVCIRLYAEDDYAARPEFTEPEIQRTNLAAVILQMAALDLGDVESFPFLDPPDSRSIRDGIALLEELGAIDTHGYGTADWLTPMGRRLSRFPLDPRLARMIIEADTNACLREVLVIVSALSIQDPRERPAELGEQADRLHARFVDPGSDFLTWLNLWEYVGDERKARTTNEFRRMCRSEFLNYRRVREWQDIHSQLRETADQVGLTRNRTPADPDLVHLSLLAGLLSHVGVKDPDGYEYRGARGARFFISPGSALFKKAPQWVMAADLVETNRMWARGVVSVSPEWIERVGAHLLSRSYSDPWWDGTRGEAVATETVTMYGLPLVADRTVGYARIDPVASRELFIRHALVAGEWDVPHRFVDHNAAVIAEILDRETRERRADLLVSDDELVAWFDARVPHDITTVVAFNRWWKDARSDTPDALDLSAADVTRPLDEDADPDAFPRFWQYGDVELPLEYEFDPASPSDGVTVDVFVGDLDRLDPTTFEWNVPGLRGELVEALIRSLPKRIRKVLAPINDTVAGVLDRVDPADGGLIDSLRRRLGEIAGEAIPIDAFDLDKLPPHLRLTYRVVDETGTVVATGSDLAVLKEGFVAETRAVLSSSEHPIERSGHTTWDFGDIPPSVDVTGDGHQVRAHPALVDEGNAVGVRLLATPQDQAEAMWQGSRRLLGLQLVSPERLFPTLSNEGKLAVGAGPHRSRQAWMDDCLAAAIDDVLKRGGGPVFEEAAFVRLVGFLKDEIAESVEATSIASLEVLDAVRSLNSSLDGPIVPAESMDDVVSLRDRLIYDGFIAGVGLGRLRDVERYVRAMQVRIERASADPGRDLERMAMIHDLELELDRLVEHFGMTSELVAIEWMIQELRVSVFAQTLGTREKVSEKRVRQALTRVAQA